MLKPDPVSAEATATSTQYTMWHCLETPKLVLNWWIYLHGMLCYQQPESGFAGPIIHNLI